MIDRIKQYRIERKIGSGGMATVYEAVDTRSHTRVAIKVLHPHLADRPDYVERFLREAHMATDLHSPHIVRVLGSGHAKVQGEELHYIVMEYVSGVTLQQFITQQQGTAVSVVQALDIAYQVSQALEEANRHGIVHRDIKPHNIMITPDGTIKVMDFGIARDILMDSLTVTGIFVGTPQYSSPEQAAGAKVDIRSDIYSLGVVLYQLLTGTVPFQADTPQALLPRVRQGNPVPVESLRVDLPKAVSEIVGRMLQRDPENRFQTPEALCEALRPLIGSHKEVARTEMATVIAPLVPKLASPSAERWWRQGKVVALVMALIVIVPLLVVLKPLPWILSVVSNAKGQDVVTSTPGGLPTVQQMGAPTGLATEILASTWTPTVSVSMSSTPVTNTLVATPTRAASTTSTYTPTVTLTHVPSATSTHAPSATPTRTSLPTAATSTPIPVKLVAPTLAGPSDSATQTGSAELQWQPVDGAAGYNVETRSDRPGQTEWRTWPAGANTELTITFDEHANYFHDPGTVYYWRVIALDAQGRPGNSSHVQKFVFQRHEVKPTDTPKPPPPPPVSGAFVNRRDIEVTDGQLALMLCVIGLMVLPLRKRS